jgi:adenylate cyclase
VPIVISEVAASLHGGHLGSLGRHELPGVGRAIEVFSLPEVMEIPRS